MDFEAHEQQLMEERVQAAAVFAKAIPGPPPSVASVLLIFNYDDGRRIQMDAIEPGGFSKIKSHLGAIVDILRGKA